MSKENLETAKVYKEKAWMYLENSAEHDNMDKSKASNKRQKLQDLIQSSLSTIPANSKVFEIGCGDGSNSKFMQSLGYDVTASDVADDFVNSAKSKGLKTITFDFLNDEFKDTYSAMLCWRVFVHFTREDVFNALKKAYDALDVGGVFIFNAINRENKSVDEEWVDFEGEYHMGVERYYAYYNKSELDDMIAKIGFKIEKFYFDGGKTNNKWLIYTLKK